MRRIGKKISSREWLAQSHYLYLSHCVARLFSQMEDGHLGLASQIALGWDRKVPLDRQRAFSPLSMRLKISSLTGRAWTEETLRRGPAHNSSSHVYSGCKSCSSVLASVEAPHESSGRPASCGQKHVPVRVVSS